MADNQLFALFIIIGASYGLWLHSQGKLQPILSEVVTPDTTSRHWAYSLSSVVIAFICYIFVLSFLDTKSGLTLTGVIVLGALIYNNQTAGNNSVLNQILTSSTKFAEVSK